MPANEDLAIGNSFLTEVKNSLSMTRKDSRTNMGEGRGSKANASPLIVDSLSPSPNMTHMGFGMSSTSPTTPNNMLVSFNFLTQVPIDEFILQENSKASKMQQQMRNTASMKIHCELSRKVKEKEQRARLDKVLNAANVKLKCDVETLKRREKEKN